MAKEKKPSRIFPYLLRIVKAFYIKYEIVGLENVPSEPAFIIGNHAQLHGPLVSQLHMMQNSCTWCAAEVKDIKAAQPYAYKDFWSGKPKNIRWLFKILSYVVAPLLVYIHTNARTIGVYHDHRVFATFRETIRRMEEGNHIIIFPEKAVPNNNILCQFQEGFVDTAKMYVKRTGKRVAFVPMYIAPKLKKVMIGAPVYYNEENDHEAERGRICAEMTNAITAMAKSLPRHTVVPYMNIAKKDYPTNI